MTLAIHHSDIKIKACCTKNIPRPFVTRFWACNRLSYQVSVYRTNGPLVIKVQKISSHLYMVIDTGFQNMGKLNRTSCEVLWI